MRGGWGCWDLDTIIAATSGGGDLGAVYTWPLAQPGSAKDLGGGPVGTWGVGRNCLLFPSSRCTRSSSMGKVWWGWGAEVLAAGGEK